MAQLAVLEGVNARHKRAANGTSSALHEHLAVLALLAFDEVVMVLVADGLGNEPSVHVAPFDDTLAAPNVASIIHGQDQVGRT